MLKNFRQRITAWLAAAGLAAFALPLGLLPANAADPLRIGFGMALTGPLAPNGKSAAASPKIWARHRQSRPDHWWLRHKLELSLPERARLGAHSFWLPGSAIGLGTRSLADTKVLIDDGMCFGCGKDNPIGLKLDFEFDGEIYSTTYTPDKTHQGWANRTHGGMLALVLDELLSRVVLVQHGLDWVTVELTTRLIKPAPVGRQLDVRTKIESLNRDT